MTPSPVRTKTVAVFLAAWLAVATVAIALGALRRVPPPLVLVSLALIMTGLALGHPAVRLWGGVADLRLFLLPHLVRVVGVAFLILVARGTLSPVFTPIGWGDLVAAVGALGLLVIGPPSHRPSSRWWAWMAWSVFGLADMGYLVLTALRVGLRAPEQFTLFRELPFGWLPTFAVPVIIVTHVLILSRLLGRLPGRRR